MMLIVADRNPINNFKFLVENTNKNFCFKQTLELAQLICSCGISNVYKPMKQGKELQKWILENKLWVFRFYNALWFWCAAYIKLEPKTLCDLYKIKDDLWENIVNKKRISYPKTGIFRYKKEYESSYESNSELPLDTCIEEYRKYIKDYKFKKE